MKLTCPRCGEKGITVGWLDCLSNASRVVPRRCDSCGGAAKRRWFSWHSFVVALPLQLGVLPMLLDLRGFLPLTSFCVGAPLTLLLHGFWTPFAPWPALIVVPPVLIPPEDEA